MGRYLTITAQAGDAKAKVSLRNAPILDTQLAEGVLLNQISTAVNAWYDAFGDQLPNPTHISIDYGETENG